MTTTTHPQYSKRTDAALDKLSYIIGVAERLIAIGTRRKDAAWEEVINYFHEMPAKGDRFIASDGRYLQLQKRAKAPTLDPELLKTLIYERLQGKSATRAWNAITKDVVDPVLLESAVRAGLVPHELVLEAMTDNPPTLARVHPEWSREDLNRAVIFGVSFDIPTNEGLIMDMEHMIREGQLKGLDGPDTSEPEGDVRSATPS